MSLSPPSVSSRCACRWYGGRPLPVQLHKQLSDDVLHPVRSSGQHSHHHHRWVTVICRHCRSCCWLNGCSLSVLSPAVLHNVFSPKEQSYPAFTTRTPKMTSSTVTVGCNLNKACIQLTSFLFLHPRLCFSLRF